MDDVEDEEEGEDDEDDEDELDSSVGSVFSIAGFDENKMPVLNKFESKRGGYLLLALKSMLQVRACSNTIRHLVLLTKNY